MNPTGTQETIGTNRGAGVLLLSVEEVAALLGCSPSHVWRLHASGKVPKPVKLGRLVRWRRAEIAAWVGANAPPRSQWYWTPEKAI